MNDLLWSDKLWQMILVIENVSVLTTFDVWRYTETCLGVREDEYHPFKRCLPSKEEEQLEDNFWVLTLASGRKEGPDLEMVSSQWQLEVEPGENSAERPEEEQRLGHLHGSTGVEEDSGKLPPSL
ncbi:hypothetical protein NDU88_005646 [Pleurodeles waltl]|uniref:Uncharacterized protein n=1 Tax=Pleurodeles waltl TaxID=8319 RepID=A0AAV7RM71_PLEWA|nr:hypothetical protein NDU88_005646 [Pleurodeles waltl]